MFLNKDGFKILNLKSPFIEKAIYKSCLIKKRIVETDEKEVNLRKRKLKEDLRKVRTINARTIKSIRFNKY